MSAETADLSSLRINRNSPTESSGGSRGKIILSILIILGLAGGGYWYFTGGAASFSKIEVETAVASMTSSAQSNSVLAASGYVVAQRKASISSKATGRLEQLYVIEGDHVKTGSIIGRIESSDVQAALRQAQASLDVAKANYASAVADMEEASSNLTRQRGLQATQSNTKAELETAEARYKRETAKVASSKAAIAVAEAAIRSAEVQIENTVIRAPFDGTVLSKNANVGEVITALGAAAGSRGAVVTLADMSSLEVEADVSESNIQKIQTNQPCQITLDAYSDKHYAGYVGKIIPTADRAKATVQVKVRFRDRDSSVIPEMSAKVLFLKPQDSTTSAKQEQEASKLLIPAKAVVMRNGQSVVFVLQDNKAEERRITKGGDFNGFIEIISGLTAGDKVVINPPDALKNGASVKIKE